MFVVILWVIYIYICVYKTEKFENTTFLKKRLGAIPWLCYEKEMSRVH